jgi:transposase
VRIGYRWAEERFPGDEEGFALVDAERRQDRHLPQWEASERDRAIGARRELYRIAAKRIAMKFPRVVLANLDLSNTARRARGEEKDVARASRVYRFDAAAGEFRDALEKAVVGSGGTVEWRDVPARACHSCGGVCSWNAETQERHTCEHCGTIWQADENQCRKLLAALANADAA